MVEEIVPVERSRDFRNRNLQGTRALHEAWGKKQCLTRDKPGSVDRSQYAYLMGDLT